jgi:2,3-diaminopropionate biosynthesis protein SbnA
VIRSSVLDAIGATPLVALSRLYPHRRLELYAKLEAVNPGGSMKDRPAWHIIRCARDAGLIQSETIVIESSSGNMGIGLAQVCRYLGLRFLCVVDPRITPQNLGLLRVYGAEVDIVTEPDPRSGEFLQARIARVQELMTRFPSTFWPNQYANHHNAEAHAQTTMREIAEALDDRVDYVLCATSTCGTLRGCAEYSRAAGLATRIVAVDAIGSAIFSTQRAARVIPGFGAGMVPELLDRSLVDGVVHVSDRDCVVGCRRLLWREAILAGGSGGALVMAIEQLGERLHDGARCVLVLPDRGDRYLDTIYSDDWVAAHFGNVADLCMESPAGSIPAASTSP